MEDKTDEILDEVKLNQEELEENKDLPEAPASATVRIQTPGGFEWMLTMRTKRVGQLVKQIEALEDLIESKGWKVPDWQTNGRKEAQTVKKQKVETKKCPECGSTMYLRTVKKPGKNQGRKFWSCSNKNCNHFEWAN